MYPLDGTGLIPEVLQPFIGGVALPVGHSRALELPDGIVLGEVHAETLAALSEHEVELLVSCAADAVRNDFDKLKRTSKLARFEPTSIAAAWERLSRRAYNAAGRTGLLELRVITDVRISRLATENGVGPNTLLEILALARVPPEDSAPLERAEPLRTRSRAVKAAASKLAAKRWAPMVRRGDPRLRSLFSGRPVFEGDARSLAENIGDGAFTPSEARATVARLRSMIETAESLRTLTVEEEADELIQAALPRSHAGAHAVRFRLGLAGKVPCTLQAAAIAADITRERVRQVEQVFAKGVREAPAWTPAFDSALRHVVRSLPARVADLESSLVELRMTHGLSIQSLYALAATYGREAAFKIDRQGEWVFGGDSPIDAIESTARRLVSHWGATTAEEVLNELEDGGVALGVELVRALLSAIDGQVWLDKEKSWFWISGLSRNRLLNQIEKIMSVAGSLTLGELRDGVGRHHRMQAFRPPREVLARLCEASGLYLRDGEEILERPGLRSWTETLGVNERLLAGVLFEHGPVMRRDELERISCGERGLNRSSFYVYLTYSPILARFAPGVYGLRGARVKAAEVKALIPPRVRTQRLRDHGWTSTREVWITYEISASSAHSGVLSIPGSLRDVISGAFSLWAEDGRPVGTLGIRGHAMWGLSPYFRRWGVEEGDYILVTLDPVQRRASVTAGTQELLLRHQTGE